MSAVTCSTVARQKEPNCGQRAVRGPYNPDYLTADWLLPQLRRLAIGSPQRAVRVRSQIRWWTNSTEAGFSWVLRFPLPILIPSTASCLHRSCLTASLHNKRNKKEEKMWSYFWTHRSQKDKSKFKTKHLKLFYNHLSLSWHFTSKYCHVYECEYRRVLDW
jgi:hypothetical protein